MMRSVLALLRRRAGERENSALPRSFLCDRQGGVAIEYGLIAALIAIAMVTGLSSIDPGFDRLKMKISEGLSGTPTAPE